MRGPAVPLSVIATLGFASAAWRGALDGPSAAAADAVVIAGLVIVALLGHLRPDDDVVSEFDAATRRRVRDVALPADFLRAERLVKSALTGRDNLLRDRFVPYLRQIAWQRLSMRSATLSPELRDMLADDRDVALEPASVERLLEEVERI